MINWLCGLCLAVQLATSGAGYLERNYPASVIQDARLTTLELLAKYRHPSEEHFVTTSDGYILALHRIPRPGAQPVLLVHGILDSSASWILMGPRNGLAYYLYDSGYDVWLGNCRGNTYSRNHTSLNPSKDRAFWNFSWHEIGLYDLPAMIDKVLDATSFKKLTYYGHSQGTTVMASSLPAYNDKVILINALAPVAFLNHIKTKLVKVVRAMMALLFGKDKPMELLPRSKLMLKMCFISKTVLNLCMNYVSRAVGGDMKKINKTMIPVILGHLPAGSSIRQVQHYLQLIKSGRFCSFEYSPKKSMLKYGSLSPIDYNIENITVPVALYVAENDYLTVPEDIQRLARQLSNVVAHQIFNNWNHADIIWATNARRRLQPKMVEISRRLEYFQKPRLTTPEPQKGSKDSEEDYEE